MSFNNFILKLDQINHDIKEGFKNMKEKIVSQPKTEDTIELIEEPTTTSTSSDNSSKSWQTALSEWRSSIKDRVYGKPTIVDLESGGENTTEEDSSSWWKNVANKATFGLFFEQEEPEPGLCFFIENR